MDKKNKKFKWYTNGIKTVKVYEDEEIPVEYHLGRTIKSNPWNKGLTKEIDERVAANGRSTSKGMREKQVIPWNKGLTKETSESLQRVSEKVSAARKGKPSWNKGIPQSEEAKRKMSESKKGKKLSSEILFQSRLKEYETKKKNGSYSFSAPEWVYYEYLLSIYQEDDIIHQYRSDEYPFVCDFYIQSESKYIELNLHWTHGGHPFDKDSLEDQQTLEEWIRRSKESFYYTNAIAAWTTKDPLKLETARKNNLNFEFIYPNNLIITS